MLNIIYGINLLLGLSVMFFGILLYCLSIALPNLSRNRDTILATFASLYGIIMLIHGWRLDPILIFSQWMIIIVLHFMGWETIRLRGLFDSATGKLANQIEYNYKLRKVLSEYMKKDKNTDSFDSSK